MIKETSSNQPVGRDSECNDGVFLKSFKILTVASLNGQMSLDKLKINRSSEAMHLPNSGF